MVFSSIIFLFAFLPAVLGLYYLLPRGGRNALLLAASLLFYAWGELGYVAVMLVSILVNYGFGRWIEAAPKKSRPRLLRCSLGVTANLSLLLYFKYANFLVDNLNALTGLAGLPALPLDPVHLPLGISFFTFQALSYIIDVHRGHVAAQRSLPDIALYISLFPQLIAGPIVRYLDVNEQIRGRRETIDLFASGVRLFLVGLGKKVLIANPCGAQTDAIFAIDPAALPAPVAWMGLTFFLFQLYFDFAGYSDMAIGLGRMFGFQFLPNFNYPYISKSLTEFWQRWHISLSTWFRDYLFTPLGGYRCHRVRAYANLMLVFILCGLWHGASWNFLFFGLYQAIFLVIERLVRIKRIPLFQTLFGNLYLLAIIYTTMVFFRSDDLPHALGYYRAMFGFSDPVVGLYRVAAYLNPEIILTLIAGALGSIPFIPWLAAKLNRPGWIIPRDLAALLALAAIFIWSVMKLAAGTHNPFIYFRF
jgi:alginate O-acetyltransferase complex protein AlgI